MPIANRLWGLLRPEASLLVVVPTVALVLLACFGMLNWHLLSIHFWTTALYFLFFGWQFFFLVCLVVVTYVWARLISRATGRWLPKPSATNEFPLASARPASQSPKRLQTARGFAGLTAAYSYALAVHIIAMDALFHPNPQRVAWANELMMRADHAIFGVYVPFAMHEEKLFRVLSVPMLISYVSMSSVLSLVFTALCVFHANHFRQYVLAFLMIMYIGLPFWFAVPAISPSEAYRVNKLGVNIPANIARDIAVATTHLDPKVLRFIERIEPYESDPAWGRFAVTTFPSMHVAWGILIAWFGIRLYPRSAPVLAPWAALNMLGAIYTLQHYAVDVVAGAVVTVVAVVLVRGLVVLESRCGLQPPGGYEVLGFVRKDVESFGAAIRRFVKRTVGRV